MFECGKEWMVHVSEFNYHEDEKFSKVELSMWVTKKSYWYMVMI